MFNLVGQVLVYSLQQQGFFIWWGKSDPTSLYADDGTLIVWDTHQLSAVLHYIGIVGQFTGLTLNLQKTIACSHQNKSYILAGIGISNTPVKYLGAMVGAEDLSTANFEHLLWKARKIATKWCSRHLTIPAYVLVAKTFVFSTFIDVCNYVYLTIDQLQLLKSILNQFIWQGKNKI